MNFLADTTTITDTFIGTAFSHSNIYYVDPQHRVWFGRSDRPKHLLNFQDRRTNLRLVTDGLVYPLNSNILPLTTPDPDMADMRIKRPSFPLLDNELEPALCARLFQEELQLHAGLFHNQQLHPNIVQCFGVIVTRGFVTGIALRAYPTTLQQEFDRGMRDMDVAVFRSDVETGIRTLHWFGWAHNDLNPNTIAIDNDGRAVIADLGSCMTIGATIHSQNTAGWPREHPTSNTQNDWIAIERLTARVEKELTERVIESSDGSTNSSQPMSTTSP